MAVVFNPSSGDGNKTVSVSSSVNEGVGSTVTYKIATNNGAVSKNIVVNQVGKREAFMVKTADGSNYEPFLCNVSGEYDVLKP